MKIMTKTPKIDYRNSVGFKSFSDFHKDAIYTVQIIKETYPRLYDKIPDFDQKSNQFIEKASQIVTEKDFDISLKKFISILNDGHSNYRIDFNKYDKTLFGLSIYKEKENWIIGNIDKEIDSTIIGKRIVSINNIPIKEIEQKIIEFESGENEHYKYFQFLSHYSFPSYWEAIEISTSGNKNLNIEVENNGKISSFNLKEKEKSQIKGYKVKPTKPKYRFTFKQNNGFYDTISKNQNFAYLQMNTCLDYVSVKSGIDNYTNFITKPLALFFLKKYKKDARDFGKFIQSFFKRVQEQKINNLIIDLSNNTGGSEKIGKQLIWYLTDKGPKGFTEYINNSDYFKTQIKEDYKEYNSLYKAKYQTELPKGEVNITEKILDKPYFEDITKKNSPYLLDKTIPKFKGKVYVIIGPQTFSAGQVLATTIADNKLATIIGKPTGNKPTTQTAASAFKLPNTKKIISLSYLYMERPDKTKNQENALYPDVEIYNTFQDLLNGNNQVMEYILNQTKR
ncbi:S41 family peptidase [Flavobacterium flavipallidum]|uniref:S41 family peptidase n=1 Tax=Flavobacterium flavipallidum TaxID=3139140 RepID=A0ABU9HMW0_9FLAO